MNKLAIKTSPVSQLPNFPTDCRQSTNLCVAAGRNKLREPLEELWEGACACGSTNGHTNDLPHRNTDKFCSYALKKRWVTVSLSLQNWQRGLPDQFHFNKLSRVAIALCQMGHNQILILRGIFLSISAWKISPYHCCKDVYIPTWPWTYHFLTISRNAYLSPHYDESEIIMLPNPVSG
jgi:hypothetical protein